MSVSIDTLCKPLQSKLPTLVVTSLKNFLCCKAFVETIKPVAERIHLDLMNEFQPKIADTGLNRKVSERVGELIDNWESLYLADDEVADRMYRESKKRLLDAGFDAEKDCCPYLCAESLLRESRRQLFEVMAQYTGIIPTKLPVKHYDKYESVLVGFLCSCAREQKIELNMTKEV